MHRLLRNTHQATRPNLFLKELDSSDVCRRFVFRPGWLHSNSHAILVQLLYINNLQAEETYLGIIQLPLVANEA